MKRLELKEATHPLTEYVREVQDEPVVFTVDGDPVAALVGIEGMDWESFSLSTNPDFIAILEQSRAQYKAEGGISSDEVRKRLGLDKRGNETRARGRRTGSRGDDS
jgi:prevent-host-death family protein